MGLAAALPFQFKWGVRLASHLPILSIQLSPSSSEPIYLIVIQAMDSISLNFMTPVLAIPIQIRTASLNPQIYSYVFPLKQSSRLLMAV